MLAGRIGWVGLGVCCLACAAPAPPTIDREAVVVGRVGRSGEVWLLTSDARLLRVSVDEGRVETTTLTGVRPGESPWGLAWDARGRLLTLTDPHTLAQITLGGAVRHRRAVDGPYVGLYAVAGRAVGQRTTMEPGSTALEEIIVAGPRRPVGSLRVSTAGTRSDTLVRHLVACGVSFADEVPCWFNGSADLDLVGPDGRGRRVRLDELHTPAADTPVSLEDRGPIIDAVVAVDGMLWVLVRSTPSDPPSRDLIVKLSPNGTALGREVLSVGARLILGASGDTCRFLGNGGQVRSVVIG